MMQIPRQIGRGVKQAFSGLTGQQITPQQKANTMKQALMVALDYAMSPQTPQAGQGGRTAAVNVMSDYLRRPPDQQEQIYQGVANQPGSSVQHFGQPQGQRQMPQGMNQGQIQSATPMETVTPTGTVSPMTPGQGGQITSAGAVGSAGQGTTGIQKAQGRNYSNRILGPGGEAPPSAGPIPQPTPISARPQTPGPGAPGTPPAPQPPQVPVQGQIQPPGSAGPQKIDPMLQQWADKLRSGEINMQQVPRFISKALIDNGVSTPEEFQNMLQSGRGGSAGMGQFGQSSGSRVSLSDVRNFFQR